MKRIIFYYLYFTIGAGGTVIFRIEGEAVDRTIQLPPADFAAVASVLAQTRSGFDPGNNTFGSFRDLHLAPLSSPAS